MPIDHEASSSSAAARRPADPRPKVTATPMSALLAPVRAPTNHALRFPSSTSSMPLSTLPSTSPPRAVSATATLHLDPILVQHYLGLARVWDRLHRSDAASISEESARAKVDALETERKQLQTHRKDLEAKSLADHHHLERARRAAWPLRALFPRAAAATDADEQHFWESYRELHSASDKLATVERALDAAQAQLREARARNAEMKRVETELHDLEALLFPTTTPVPPAVADILRGRDDAVRLTTAQIAHLETDREALVTADDHLEAATRHLYRAMAILDQRSADPCMECARLARIVDARALAAVATATANTGSTSASPATSASHAPRTSTSSSRVSTSSDRSRSPSPTRPRLQWGANVTGRPRAGSSVATSVQPPVRAPIPLTHHATAPVTSTAEFHQQRRGSGSALARLVEHVARRRRDRAATRAISDDEEPAPRPSTSSSVFRISRWGRRRQQQQQTRGASTAVSRSRTPSPRRSRSRHSRSRGTSPEPAAHTASTSLVVDLDAAGVIDLTQLARSVGRCARHPRVVPGTAGRNSTSRGALAWSRSVTRALPAPVGTKLLDECQTARLHVHEALQAAPDVLVALRMPNLQFALGAGIRGRLETAATSLSGLRADVQDRVAELDSDLAFLKTEVVRAHRMAVRALGRVVRAAAHSNGGTSATGGNGMSMSLDSLPRYHDVVSPAEEQAMANRLVARDLATRRGITEEDAVEEVEAQQDEAGDVAVHGVARTVRIHEPSEDGDDESDASDQSTWTASDLESAADLATLVPAASAIDGESNVGGTVVDDRASSHRSLIRSSLSVRSQQRLFGSVILDTPASDSGAEDDDDHEMEVHDGAETPALRLTPLVPEAAASAGPWLAAPVDAGRARSASTSWVE
ncbi:hypothetical protein AMAG_06170 [Allomyces macrogynus ATCC 38327]|uniref:Uncharacterized protein n=1 Tax=Allomyces macrogynus (strain ATCC 38327) TaxID=578462 RepID=A0A0L0SFR4_ALLM3|nr:hypothetical protein AMAG_06170 [Allomyces macrogynus ATCC 38327]|eukprot:KNE61341.1 hypothetical protein AMAG_06170 [Allomyces macrogynus ATCC 38327]